MELTPAFLLQNPELVTTVAPWCVRLDNLELGTLLVMQPWFSVGGLRRAELERRIAHLAATLPLGPIYFQRIKRTVARLEEIGAVREVAGRAQRFGATPQGFAAFVLNLQVLESDPTLAGGEFELKHALVARCNLILDRLTELSAGPSEAESSDPFFSEVESLSILGRQVVTPDVVSQAFDILRLIVTQREVVLRFLEMARQRLAQDEAGAALSGLDVSRLAGSGLTAVVTWLTDTPGALAAFQSMASSTLPRLTGQATVLRYEHYLRYLDELAVLYAGELKVVTLQTLRGVMGRRRA